MCAFLIKIVQIQGDDMTFVLFFVFLFFVFFTLVIRKKEEKLEEGGA